jgi:DNA ligase-1
MIAYFQNDHVILQSRNLKIFDGVHLNNIRNELFKFFKKFPTIVLDGELFTFQLTFEEITGFGRKSKPTDDSKASLLEYHVYDMIDTNKTFKERSLFLIENISKNYQNIHLVKTLVCEIKHDVDYFHSLFLQQGYEGIMLRNKESLYKLDKRSYDLQKCKHFEDDEFEMIHVKEGEGLEKGCAIIQCKMKNGNLFWCRPKGTKEWRQELFNHFESKYKHKFLTVGFQNLTDNGVPRFPSGIAVRDYE